MIEPLDFEIGQRIQKARIEKSLSQGELGRMLDTPRSHAAVSDIERGRTKITVTMLMEFEYILGKPLSYFLDALPPRLTARTSLLGDLLGEIDSELESEIFDDPVDSWEIGFNRGIKRARRIVEHALDDTKDNS